MTKQVTTKYSKMKNTTSKTSDSQDWISLYRMTRTSRKPQARILAVVKLRIGCWQWRHNLSVAVYKASIDGTLLQTRFVQMDSHTMKLLRRNRDTRSPYTANNTMSLNTDISHKNITIILYDNLYWQYGIQHLGFSTTTEKQRKQSTRQRIANHQFKMIIKTT